MLRDEYLKIKREFDEKEVQIKVKSIHLKSQHSQSKEIFKTHNSKVSNRLNRFIPNRNR